MNKPNDINNLEDFESPLFLPAGSSAAQGFIPNTDRSLEGVLTPEGESMAKANHLRVVEQKLESKVEPEIKSSERKIKKSGVKRKFTSIKKKKSSGKNPAAVDRGYLLVRPCDYGNGWRLVFEERVPTPSGKSAKKQTTIPEHFWQAEYGIDPNWSLDLARASCTELNLRRRDQKKSKTLTRMLRMESLDNKLFPPVMLDGFWQDEIVSSSGGSMHKRKLHSQFKVVQKLIKQLELLPPDFYEKRNHIYGYFASQKFSLNYSKNLLRLINLWGKYWSRRKNRNFDPVSPIPKNFRASISREQQQKISKNKAITIRVPSEPLTPQLLESHRKDFQEAEANWLFVSIWFGLRPNEINNLKDTHLWRVESEKGYDVLLVYQSKLQLEDEDKKWKRIPVIFPEQVQALKLIRHHSDNENLDEPLSATLKMPDGPTMRKIIKDPKNPKHVLKITPYAGRKGFVDLMRSKGQRDVDITMWMGHQSPETTFQFYKQKTVVAWTATSEVVKIKPKLEPAAG